MRLLSVCSTDSLASCERAMDSSCKAFKLLLAEDMPANPMPAITSTDTTNATNIAIKRCVIRQLFHKDAMVCNLNKKENVSSATPTPKA